MLAEGVKLTGARPGGCDCRIQEPLENLHRECRRCKAFFAESLRQKDRVRSFDLYQFVLQRCADSAEVLPDLFFLSILFPSQKRGAPMYQDLQPNIEFVNQYDPEIAALMGKELARQQRLSLIHI